MYLAVILSESKTLTTIPIEWVKNYKAALVRNFNGGLKRWRKEHIFFSDRECEADFGLDIRCNYCSSVNACYIANILKAFGSEADAKMYVEMRRPVLPVNYSDNLRKSATNETPASEDGEGFLDGVLPKPISIQTKVDDALSGKIPFELHVSFLSNIVAIQEYMCFK